MEEGILPIHQLYLLRNNSFLKQEANLSNTEYKVLSLTMAKVQKELLEKYPKWNKETIEKMPPAIECCLDIEELKQLDIRSNDLVGKNLSKMLNKLNKTEVNFISYITGGYVFSHLISEFEVSKKTGNIRALMSKQVFMFLLDYNASFDFRANFPEYEEVKNTPKPKTRLIAKGYTKLNITTIDKFKSYYTQIMFAHFKNELEKKVSKCGKIESFDITYTIDSLRKIFGTNIEYTNGQKKVKYKNYADFKKAVIDRAISELMETKCFIISYKEKYETQRGKNKVVALIFSISPGDELEYVNNSNCKRAKENAENNIVDVKYEELRNNNQTRPTSITERLVLKLKEESKIVLAVSTIQNFIDTYGETNVKRAVNSLIVKSEEERVRAPKKYLLTVLEDMYDRENNGKENISTDTIGRGNYISNNSQRLKKMREQGKDIMGFNNIPPVERDYDELERKLLGWDKDDDMVD